MSKGYNMGLNPAPTQVQLYLFRRHKKAGTSPGNPKWYRNPAPKPFVFVPHAAPKYPKLPTGAEWCKRNSASQRYGK